MRGKTIVVTSGKGGVGKTTTTANIGAGLALRGHKVVVMDTDIGLRNLDVVMGLENRIVYDLVDAIEGRCGQNAKPGGHGCSPARTIHESTSAGEHPLGGAAGHITVFALGLQAAGQRMKNSQR